MDNNNTLLGTTRITLAAATNATLKALLAAASPAAAIHSGLRRLAFIPVTATVSINYNAAATSSTVAIPQAGIDIPCGTSDAAAINLFSTAGGTVDIIQFGER